jgi:phosphatidylglycerophosphate synthase
VARHPAATPAERRAAARMLLQILVKPEDSPISKYIYRPVSRPLTRLLVGTPVTPNQISLAVLALGALGCWLVAQPGPRALAIGSGLVLLAGFIDGCDGELARLRLTTSKLGAWLDTIVDELTTGMYLAAIGYHAAQALPDQRWIAPSVVAGLACYAAGVYCIYFYLVVVSKTGNSQHYVGDLELIELPEGGPALRPRRRARPVPGPIARIGGALVLVVRRDFVNLAAFAGALANAYLAIYLAMLAGVVVAAAVMVPEHVRLRGQLRQLRRRGAAPRLAV